MKTLLYMAMSANGMIARKNDDTGFVSEVEWDSFRNMIKRVGNLVVGKRTYDIMLKNNEFSKLDKTRVIVVTSGAIGTKSSDHSTANSPEEALKILEKLGFREALVAGGGKLNASFMRSELIDEIYLDVEPVVFGRGVGLFSDEEFEAKLKLVEVNKPSANEIQLRYKVERK